MLNWISIIQTSFLSLWKTKNQAGFDCLISFSLPNPTSCPPTDHGVSFSVQWHIPNQRFTDDLLHPWPHNWAHLSGMGHLALQAKGVYSFQLNERHRLAGPGWVSRVVLNFSYCTRVHFFNVARPRLNILIFLPILGWKYSCIILKL